MGAGSIPCAKFSQVYKRSPEIMGTLYFSWAQGYLSALNIFRSALDYPMINLNIVHTDTQISQIRMYCANNPLKSYQDAVHSLYDFLQQ